tara:strand:- start:105 stop:281 length:177 start_codon:yes stop_codon:yes gene_type:complete
MKIPATILVDGENVRVMITTARGPGDEATYELFDPEKYNGQKDLYKDPLLQKWLSGEV